LSGFVGDIRRFGDVARGSYAEGLAMNLQRLARIVEETERIGEAAAVKAITLFRQMVGTLLRQHLLDAVDTQPGIQARGHSHRR
jgi:TetR/AcrR family transcriptional repressor of nem operon